MSTTSSLTSISSNNVIPINVVADSSTNVFPSSTSSIANDSSKTISSNVIADGSTYIPSSIYDIADGSNIPASK